MDYSTLEDQDYDDLISEGENAAEAFSQMVDRLENNTGAANYRLEDYTESLMRVHDGAVPYIELFNWKTGQVDQDETVRRDRGLERMVDAIKEYEQAMIKYVQLSEELERRDIAHPEPHHLINYDIDLDRFKSEINMLQNELED